MFGETGKEKGSWAKTTLVEASLRCRSLLEQEEGQQKGWIVRWGDGREGKGGWVKRIEVREERWKGKMKFSN